MRVAGADAGLNIAGSLTNDKAAARAAAATLAPGALRLDYGDVMSALERLTAGLPPPVHVHFVSDFQASGMPPRFSDVIPGGVSSLTPHVVGTGQPFNWSVDYLRAGGSGSGIDVGVTGFGDRERVGDVELRINGAVADERGRQSRSWPLAAAISQVAVVLAATALVSSLADDVDEVPFASRLERDRTPHVIDATHRRNQQGRWDADLHATLRRVVLH